MNGILRFLILPLIISLSLWSCGSDDNSPDDNEAFIRFVLDGEAFESRAAYGTINQDIVIGQNPPYNNLGIGGLLDGYLFSFFQIVINTDGIPDIGTYEYTQDCSTLEPDCAFIIMQLNATDEDEEPVEIKAAAGNTIRIEFETLEYHVDGQFSGTFEAQARDENANIIHEITEGVFNVVVTE